MSCWLFLDRSWPIRGVGVDIYALLITPFHEPEQEKKRKKNIRLALYIFPMEKVKLAAPCMVTHIAEYGSTG